MWVIDVVQKAVAEGEGSSTPKCVWDWESPRRSVQAPIVGRSQRVATTQKVLHWFSEESETVYYVDSYDSTVGQNPKKGAILRSLASCTVCLKD